MLSTTMRWLNILAGRLRLFVPWLTIQMKTRVSRYSVPFPISEFGWCTVQQFIRASIDIANGLWKFKNLKSSSICVQQFSRGLRNLEYGV